MYPTLFTTPGLKAFAEAVDAERQRQLAKFGDQRHRDGTHARNQDWADHARAACQHAADENALSWAAVLYEEFTEAMAETDPAKLRAELVQVAAVCAAWVSDLDRRAEGGEHPAPQCTAGLMPSTDEAVDRCIRHGKHDSHVTASGVRWGNPAAEGAQQ
jgi:hypothetical protein